MTDSLVLEKSVLKTLSWFDIFEYPLTLFEIKKYLLDYADPIEISEILTLIQNSSQIKQFQGFYFLNYRDNSIVEKRLEKYNLCETKLKNRRWVFKMIARIPFVKMIGICNTMAYRGASKESDIDLFVVTAKNRLWWTRMLILVFLSLFKLRPKNNDHRDKICLSFIIDETKLNLKEFSYGHDDIYFHFWMAHLWPMYDENIYANFFEQNYRWFSHRLKFVFQKDINLNYIFELSLISKLFKNIFEGIINLLFGKLTERFLYKIQLDKLPGEIKSKINIDKKVVVNQNIFKAHTGDRREEYRRIFESRLKNVQA